MELSELRKKIDGIDAEMLRLLRERMAAAEEIGAWKRERGVPVRDPAREEDMIARYRAAAGEDLAEEAERLFRLLMAMSREKQEGKA